MIISTTANIEGKSIHSYCGVVSGTDIYMVGGVFGGGLANQENLYSAALNSAIEKMQQKAANRGANAIVGVSTNFTSPGGLNYMIVVVTGTAVVIGDEENCDNPVINADRPDSPCMATVNSTVNTADTVSPAAAQWKKPEPPTPGLWKCKHCGTDNSLNYGQCKKCGKYRS